MSVNKAIAKHKELQAAAKVISMSDINLVWEDTGGRQVIDLTKSRILSESIVILNCDDEQLYCIREGYYLGDAILVEDLPALKITHDYLLQELNK